MIAWAEGGYTSSDNPHEAAVTDARARGHVEALSEWATKIEEINRVEEAHVDATTEETGDGHTVDTED